MSDILSFGLWLKRRRKALDLTQDALAQRVGCSLETIRKIEADARRPSHEIAARLADQFALAADEREAFIQVARAELSADRLAPPAHSVARAAFVPAPPSASAAETPGQRPAPLRARLPTPPTPLIGRARERAQLGALLRTPAARLLTLTGPGGIGKTRLGLQVAAEVAEDFPDGVSFVDLAPIREPPLVLGAIAHTLGLRDTGVQPLLDQLAQFLGAKRLLLLLDNFEQVLDAAPLLAALLAMAPGLKLLVTSRERLHLRGEKELAVPPLELPDPAKLPPLDQLAQYAAVALFMQRAVDASAEFQLTNANAAAVAEICTRLDGLPLAIELAAARIKLLPPAALLARLSSRLALLTSGARDLPLRQQTMRATIAWSYDLLTEAEQTLLRRLGVFVGDCTLQAAEGVCGAMRTRSQGDEATEEDHAHSVSPELPVPVSMLDGLATLVDKSLLWQVAGSGDEPRFVMLETIREYALERLEASGETARLRQLHARYYVTHWDLPHRIPASPAPLAQLERDYDNLWSALAWSQTAAGDPEIGVRIAGGLRTLWMRRGMRREAIAALERSLNHPRGVGRTVGHAAARYALGHFLFFTADYAAARHQLEQAVQLAHEIGDPRWASAALNRLGWVAREQGDSATAWARLSESLAIYREQGDAVGIASGLGTMAGLAILDEDPVRAEALLAERRTLRLSEPDHPNTRGWVLNSLGQAAQLRGEYDRAAQLHHESRACFQAYGDFNPGLPHAYHNLGETTLELGDVTEAARWLGQGLALSQTLGDQATIAWCMGGLGSVAGLDEEPVRAARLWGAAERVRQAIGCRAAPAARATYERALAAARSQLSAEAFAAALTEGQVLTLEQAIAYALEGSVVD